MLSLAVLLAELSASLLGASAAPARFHTVSQIIVGGTQRTSAAGVTVTPRNGRFRTGIRKGERLDDGTRVDVPAGVVVVVTSTGAKSTARLEPGSSITFVTTGKGELVRARGRVLFDVVHGALDFFRVREGDQITAGVNGTLFSIDAEAKTVAFVCKRDSVTIGRSGFVRIAGERKAVTLYDLLAADAKWHVTYDLDRPDLATFTTLGDAVATYRAQAASAAQRANVPAQLAALANLAAVQQAGGDGAGASATLADALELARSADARDAEARFALQLAGVRGDGNDYAAALEAARRALVLSRAIGDPEGIARASSAINRLRLGTPPP